MRNRLVRTDVGGWLFRCNPNNLDEFEAVERGHIESWCAVDTYRLALITAGQPVALWVTGPAGASPPPGIWLAGYTSGWVQAERQSDPAGDPPGRPRRHVGLRDMRRLRDPLPREVIAAHPVTAHMEVLRQPFGANPSCLSPIEQSALAGLIGGWP